MKKFIPGLLLAGLMATSFTIQAEPARYFGGHQFLQQERVAEKLGLSDEQRSEIKTLIDTHQAAYPRDKADFKTHRSAMDDLINAPEFDATAAEELLTQNLDKHVAGLRLQHDIRQVLTEDQRNQIDNMKARMAERGKEKFREHKKERRKD